MADSINLSGNVALTQSAAGSGGLGDTAGIGNTLLAGDIEVYVNPSGAFTPDELARIQDAIATWDAVLAPESVAITEVGDRASANVVIDFGSTSACGGLSQGVLGCYDGSDGEVAIIQGWSWYAGANAAAIGPDQYDFETTVVHELGHALGLGHSSNPASPMYATLATGVADRVPTARDLDIPDPSADADPQLAAGFAVLVPQPKAHPLGGEPTVATGPMTTLGPPAPILASAAPASTAAGGGDTLSGELSIAQVSTIVIGQAADPRRTAGFVASPALANGADAVRSLIHQAIDEDGGREFGLPRPGAEGLDDELLDELTADPAVRSQQKADRPIDLRPPALLPADELRAERGEKGSDQHGPSAIPAGPLSRCVRQRRMAGPTDILLASGLCGVGAGLRTARPADRARTRRRESDADDGSSFAGGH